jgi:hypothetical protein
VSYTTLLLVALLTLVGAVIVLFASVFVAGLASGLFERWGWVQPRPAAAAEGDDVEAR